MPWKSSGETIGAVAEKDPALCPKNDMGEHELDDGNVTPADGHIMDGRSIVADVWCRLCGRSGSVVIELSEVNW